MARAVGTGSVKQEEPAGTGSPVLGHETAIGPVRTQMASARQQELGHDEI